MSWLSPLFIERWMLDVSFFSRFPPCFAQASTLSVPARYAIFSSQDRPRAGDRVVNLLLFL
jgi:hypothetical protein